MTKEKFLGDYFRFNEQDAMEYSVEVLRYFDSVQGLNCKEIGDGNLNYIFRVYHQESQKSVIIKQAGPVARISEDISLSPDRNRIESEILKKQFALTDGKVPEVYLYDSKMNCTSMEDLSDHTILRTALLNFDIFPNLAKDLAIFMIQTLIPTSDISMEHKAKKENVKSFINGELCEISEDLVFTEPYYDCQRNDMLEETKQFVSDYIWQDSALKLKVAQLKFNFMTNAESLIHGDLHSGSIFAKVDSTKVIDPEFAFYGPAAYDSGNVMAHFIFAQLHAKYSGKSTQEFDQWILETIKDTINIFIEEFNAKWDSYLQDEMAKVKGFKEYYLNHLLDETAAYAGTEIIRRIVGLAHVKDITCLPHEIRVQAEKEALEIGKKLILESANFKDGSDYIAILK